MLFGEFNIPAWHPLYDKKYWRCGWYTRKLKLYDGIVIQVVVYRFYCPETRRTYSLLPFFISRYERHINSIIESMLYQHFVEKLPCEKIAEEPSPSVRTVRRWVHKFGSRLDLLRIETEAFLIKAAPSNHLQLDSSPYTGMKFIMLMDKAKALEKDPNHRLLYASLSYILLAAGIFTASL